MEKRLARQKGDREISKNKKKVNPIRRNDEAYNRRKTNSLKNPMIVPEKKGLGRIWNKTNNKDVAIPAYGANFSSSVTKAINSLAVSSRYADVLSLIKLFAKRSRYISILSL